MNMLALASWREQLLALEISCTDTKRDQAFSDPYSVARQYKRARKRF